MGDLEARAVPYSFAEDSCACIYEQEREAEIDLAVLYSSVEPQQNEPVVSRKYSKKTIQITTHRVTARM